MFKEFVDIFVSSLSSSPTCMWCGWAAAVGAMVGYGSFGVPIKAAGVNDLRVDPLVFQSWKTGMCLFTSWIIVLLTKGTFSFTPWGIMSGTFWVPGGVSTIFAIQNCGLALGLGIIASCIVFVSFIWGIFVFSEHIESLPIACGALAAMIVGIMGMSIFSAPDEETEGHQRNDISKNRVVFHENDHVYHALSTADNDEESPLDSVKADEQPNLSNGKPADSTLPAETDDRLCNDDNREDEESPYNWFGMTVSRRMAGIVVALVGGMWAGSIMVPMRWCNANTTGADYLISFAVGSTIVNVLLWVARYLYNVVVLGGCKNAYQALPKSHFSVLWKYGGMAGLIWSIGNFFSLISVSVLGEAVGFSATQVALLVAGLWGIFYFREVKGCLKITKWFGAAFVTVAGMLLLGYEHSKK